MEEVKFFGRISAYALVVGVAYWFLSYEPAGTVLLIGFGLATGAGFLVLRSGAHGGDPRPIVDAVPGAEPNPPDGPFGDESGPVPTRSSAPLAVGFGAATMALAGAFGPWFLIAGVVPLVIGAVTWLRAADRELELRVDVDAVEAGGPAAAARHPSAEARAADPEAEAAAGS